MGKLRHREVTAQGQLVSGEARMYPPGSQAPEPSLICTILRGLSGLTVTKSPSLPHTCYVIFYFTPPGLHIVLAAGTSFRSY